MSAKTLSWVFDNSPYVGTAYTVHIVLGDIANEQHENALWLSHDSIAARARTTRKTVQKILNDMVDDGYLKLLKQSTGRGNTNTYQFLMPEIVKNWETVHQDKVDESVTSGDTLKNASVTTGDTLTTQSVTSEEESVTRGYTELKELNNDKLNTAATDIIDVNKSLTANTRTRRPGDDIFDTLVLVFGQPETKTAKSFYGQCVRELMEVNATPEDITSRAAEARRRWSKSVEFTPKAILKHWESLSHKSETTSDLKGNAQLGKDFLPFKYEKDSDLVEQLGGKIYGK